jgi:tetratricopeptide (TPR) repeat protein
MEISNKKLKFITRNAGKMTPAQMAGHLKMSEKQVQKAMADIGAGDDNKTPANNFIGLLPRIVFYLFALFAGLAPFFIRLDLYDFANLPQSAFIQTGVIVFLLLWAVSGALKKELYFFPTRFWLPLTLFLLWSLISLLWAANRYEGMTAWVHWLASFFALFLASTFIQTRRDALFLLNVIFVSGFLVVALGILQFMELAAYLPLLGDIHQVYVPAATFANKNVAVHFVILTLPLGIGFFLVSQKPWQYWLYGMATSLMTVLVLYTGTRAGWVAMFFITLFFGVVFFALAKWGGQALGMKKGKWICLSACLLVFFVSLNLGPNGFTWRVGAIQKTVSVTLKELYKQFDPEHKALVKPIPPAQISVGSEVDPDEDELPLVDLTPPRTNFDVSQELRWAIYRNSMVMIKDHFWLGVGLGNHKVHYPAYVRSAVVEKIFSEDSQLTNVHNDYIQAFAETGFIGFAFLAWLFGAMTLSAWRLIKDSSNPKRRILAVSLYGGVLGILVMALFCFPFQRAIPPFVLMVYLGIASFWEREIKAQKPVQLPWQAGFFLSALLLVGLVMTTRIQSKRIEADRQYILVTSAERMSLWEAVRDRAQMVAKLDPHRKKALSYLGRAYIELGEYELGIEALEKVIQAYPYHMNALLNIGVAYAALGEHEKALSVYDKVLNIKPDYGKAHNNVANVLLHQEKLPEALRAFRIAGAYEPENPVVQFNIGIVAARLEKWELSAQGFERALELQPDWIAAHANLGQVLLYHLNRPEQAMIHLARADALRREQDEALRSAPGSRQGPPGIVPRPVMP